MGVRATWDLSLLCDCPVCGCTDVNLLELPEFWEERTFQACQAVRDIEVRCPLCMGEFLVDTVF